MVQIETARLRLRLFTLDDLDAYHTAIFSDPDVTRFLPGGAPRPRDGSERVIRRFLEHWQQHDFGIFAVEYEGQVIGHCGLQYIPDTNHVELAYALAKSCWGKGLASEAAAACLRYGFEHLALDRIVAVFVPENTASERVMQKIGMHHVGLLACYGTELPCYALEEGERTT